MVKGEIKGSIGVLTIERPDRRNALSDSIVHSLRDSLARFDMDPGVNVMIITGCAPGFCAGSDLKELATMDLHRMCEHESDTARFCRSIAHLRKPVIAAVDGFALGGGLVFAASCDIVVTTPGCRWHLPEVKIGWIPPWGLETLVARLGPIVARRLVWGGDECDGAEAYRLGLADYLAEPGQAFDKALSIAERLAALPDVSVASTKAYFSAQATRDGENGDVLANRLFEDNCTYSVAKATLKKFGVRV